MQISLRKINQLIREAWTKGQAAALRGAGKSSCYSWSDRVARDYFPHIPPQDVTLIATGKARLHWDAEKREIAVVSTTSAEPSGELTIGEPAASPLDRLQREDRLRSSEPRGSVTYVDLEAGVSYRTIAVHEGVAHDAKLDGADLRSIETDDGQCLHIGNVVQESRRYRVTVEIVEDLP